MARKWKKIALAVILVGFLASCAPPVFYLVFAKAANWEVARRGLNHTDQNAVKHAYAAIETYSALRPVFGAARSADFVMALGEMNEWIEYYFKPEPDWSREVYKDMRNNLSGIEAAEWLYREAGWTSPFTRLHLAGRLAADNLLIPMERDPRIASVPNDPYPGNGLDVMRADRRELAQSLGAEIAVRQDELRTDLGL